jgi:methionine aminopeptidase
MAVEMDIADVNVEMEEGVEEEPAQDLTNSDVVTKYKLAAEIANKTLEGLSRYCKPGKRVVDVCALGDNLIEQQCQSVFKSKKIEKGAAFPTSVSVNEVVCHMSPLPSETTVLAEGDLVKM